CDILWNPMSTTSLMWLFFPQTIQKTGSFRFRIASQNMTIFYATHFPTFPSLKSNLRIQANSHASDMLPFIFGRHGSLTTKRRYMVDIAAFILVAGRGFEPLTFRL